MKKLIQLTIILALGTMTQQCRDHENFEISDAPKLQKKTTDSIPGLYKTNYDLWELDPDPPVRDGQDWKQP
ncbi:hypothetical protein J2X97_000800 [Epilithonimonas hungarica]|jgi:hypothetical protein|uniref:hypothetical protein n=1 Tax=Epilithonimonas hungarica TaxID=454006 RepID=UPI0027877C88|nr:hypothetical protein [Epilithonimonas hungarica]MDP9955163.1 hypothetical protein [Epilithonimonas hungarica]